MNFVGVYYIIYYRSNKIFWKLKNEKQRIYNELLTLEIEFNFIKNFTGSSINSPLTNDTAIRNPLYYIANVYFKTISYQIHIHIYFYYENIYTIYIYIISHT